jgi:hypothetical protein
MRHKYELPQIKIILTEHFIDQWCRYVEPAKKTKIRSTLRSAIRNKIVYGRSDGSFEVFIGGTKAILELTAMGWIGVTVLPPDSAEMILHRTGLDELARKWGARLSF